MTFLDSFLLVVLDSFFELFFLWSLSLLDFFFFRASALIASFLTFQDLKNLRIRAFAYFRL